jgi:plasmid maintenance system antidote protein VapI
MRPWTFGLQMEVQFWLSLQARYDLLQAEFALASSLKEEVHPYVAAQQAG